MTYYVLPVAEVTEDVLTCVHENVLSTCRKSLDGTLAVVKCRGATPAPLQGYPAYTHAEILALLLTAAWSAGGGV